VTGRLIQLGVEVYSPLVHGYHIERLLEPRLKPGVRRWIDHGRAWLNVADFLAVLTIEGWCESLDVRRELTHARGRPIPVIFIDESLMEIN
jgi:hypothetical protein